MKRKYWQGTKDAANYSDTSRRFLKGAGRSVQGSSHPSPLQFRLQDLQLGMVAGCLRDKAIVLQEASWVGE